MPDAEWTEHLRQMRAEGERLRANAATETPRRIDLLRMTSAESAITAAMAEVERMPADVRLTDAVLLLNQARDKVADFVDGVTP